MLFVAVFWNKIRINKARTAKVVPGFRVYGEINMSELKSRDTTEAAKYLGGYSPITLAIWRHQKRGPDYMRICGRISYTEEQLDEFIQKSVVTN